MYNSPPNKIWRKGPLTKNTPRDLSEFYGTLFGCKRIPFCCDGNELPRITGVTPVQMQPELRHVFLGNLKIIV